MGLRTGVWTHSPFLEAGRLLLYAPDREASSCSGRAAPHETDSLARSGAYLQTRIEPARGWQKMNTYELRAYQFDLPHSAHISSQSTAAATPIALSIHHCCHRRRALSIHRCCHPRRALSIHRCRHHRHVLSPYIVAAYTTGIRLLLLHQ